MKQLGDPISKHLCKRKEKLAIAESVTGGDIQSALSVAENAMQFFEGGIVTYTLEQKVRHLNVNREEALRCNCVSGDIAGQMAKGVAALFHTEWGIAITGYASPVPEKGIFNLFAWLGIVYKENAILVEQIIAEDSNEDSVRRHYNRQVLERYKHVLEVFG